MENTSIIRKTNIDYDCDIIAIDDITEKINKLTGIIKVSYPSVTVYAAVTRHGNIPDCRKLYIKDNQLRISKDNVGVLANIKSFENKSDNNGYDLELEMILEYKTAVEFISNDELKNMYTSETNKYVDDVVLTKSAELLITREQTEYYDSEFIIPDTLKLKNVSPYPSMDFMVDAVNKFDLVIQKYMVMAEKLCINTNGTYTMEELNERYNSFKELYSVVEKEYKKLPSLEEIKKKFRELKTYIDSEKKRVFNFRKRVRAESSKIKEEERILKKYNALNARPILKTKIINAHNFVKKHKGEMNRNKYFLDSLLK